MTATASAGAVRIRSGAALLDGDLATSADAAGSVIRVISKVNRGIHTLLERAAPSDRHSA